MVLLLRPAPGVHVYVAPAGPVACMVKPAPRQIVVSGVRTAMESEPTVIVTVAVDGQIPPGPVAVTMYVVVTVGVAIGF